jgi:hypothetical protein
MVNGRLEGWRVGKYSPPEKFSPGLGDWGMKKGKKPLNLLIPRQND